MNDPYINWLADRWQDVALEGLTDLIKMIGSGRMEDITVFVAEMQAITQRIYGYNMDGTEIPMVDDNNLN